MPSPNWGLSTPTWCTSEPRTTLSLEKPRRWMPSAPIWLTSTPSMTAWFVPSATMPLLALRTVSPRTVQWSAPTRCRP